MVRVWCLRTKAPLAILHGHTGAINTLQFSPQCRGDTRVLVSAGADGCVCFWLWSVSKCTFNSKPIKFVERSHAGAQMLCSSFSPGGMFLATGNSDHVIRVYFLHAQAPEKICELEAHTNKVDSMCYSNNYNRFVSGSEDGTARIWRYERQEWRAIVLNMATKLNSDGTEVVPNGSSISVRVTMVCWNVDDSLVMTAVSDFSVKVWDANTGKLLHVLQSHQDEVFVLEGSPVDGRIVVSAGHDGHIIIWDVVAGVKIKSFFNSIQGQGFGAVYDCKFTPDGQSFAATDSHGHLLFFGFGVNEKIKQVPQEVFFHTDYRPLIRDANSYVLDEQTQQPPHLMPSPFLVNIDGNPYPPALQRLVPGRENLKETQLVPEIGINEAGDSEVIGDGAGAPNQEHPHHVPHLPEPVAIPQQNGVVDDDTEDEGEDEAGQIHDRVRPSIDELIRQLQQEQDQRILAQGGEVPLASPPPPDRRASSSFEGRVGMRRSGETEGVRQSLGSVSQRATSSDLAAWRKRVVVRELDKGVLKTTEDKRTAFADEEIRKFITERKKKPSVPNTPSTLFGQVWKGKQTSGKGETNSSKKQPEADLEVTARNRLTTRALYDTEEEEEEEAAFDALPSDYSDSGEYSDWIMEGSSNLQPPKRRSQRKPKRKHISSSDDDDDEDEANLVVDDDDDDTTDDDDDDDHEEYKQSTKQEPKEKSKKKVFMPSGKGKSKKPYKQKVVVPKNFPKVTELQEEFRPPEWLTGTIPRKTPYVPQMGDEVMYFRQGHELYLQAVQRHKAYEINPNVPMPWDKMPLGEMELVKIVGIRYEVKPPRLCNLKLAFLNPDTGKLLGRSFSIRYHDMPDVIDFLVLRQNFDISFKRKWKLGDRFRSMIDDQWWMGKIESQSPLNPLFPDSHFQSLYVHWDNGEFERLSPWDMEPINNNCELVPSDVGGGVPVDNEELRSLLYSPKPGEWSSEGREIETERILCGIEAVMEHSAAEPFNAPVDLNAFPEYGIIIEYPIDLSTIKARLENGYYRRINALQWDIRHIESNAKKFNEDGTSISRSASIITETLLQFIGNKECRDPMPILDRLSHGLKFHWGKDKAANSSSDEATSSSSGSKRKRVEDVDEGSNSSKRQCIEAYRDPLEWKERCWELLGIMLECEDAEPFKEPVNTNDYPDYLAVVEVPIDFGTVGCRLQNGHYTSPLDFAENVRLIFSNSRLYNPNKRSRIYTMTIRLSAMFEERIRKILTAYRAATKSRKQTATPSNRAGTSSSSAAAERAKAFAARVQSRVSGSTSQDGEPSGAGPSTSRVPPSRKTGDDRAKHRAASPSKKRPRVKDDSDDDNTEVENGDDDDTEEEDYKGEENKTTDFDGPRRADASSDKENYKDDDDTEIEDNAHPGSTQNGKVRSRGSSHSAGQAQLSNGHPKYRTRAKTGSLKPKRYASSEEEDEKDLRSRKNNKRAESLSSRDSSIHFPDDEDDDDDDDESGTTSSSSSSDSDSSRDGEKKRKSKSGRHHQPKSRQKTKIQSQKIKQKRHRSASSSDDDSNDEESSESDSDSDSSDDTPPQRRAAQPKGRATLDVRKGHSGGSSKNHSSGSGTRTTRNQGKRTVHYLEDSEDDYYEDASHLSVSSRGRLRKMTKRARALHDD